MELFVAVFGAILMQLSTPLIIISSKSFANLLMQDSAKSHAQVKIYHVF